MADGLVLSRVIANQPLHCGQKKCTPSLRGDVHGADTTGPAVARVGTIQLNSVSSNYCPNRDEFAFRRSAFCVLVLDTRRTQWKTIQQQG